MVSISTTGRPTVGRCQRRWQWSSSRRMPTMGGCQTSGLSRRRTSLCSSSNLPYRHGSMPCKHCPHLCRCRSMMLRNNNHMCRHGFAPCNHLGSMASCNDRRLDRCRSSPCCRATTMGHCHATMPELVCAISIPYRGTSVAFFAAEP